MKLERINSDMFKNFESEKIQNLHQVLGGRTVTKEKTSTTSGGCDIQKWSHPDDDPITKSDDGFYRCDMVTLPPESTWDDLPYNDVPTPEIGDEWGVFSDTGEIFYL